MAKKTSSYETLKRGSDPRKKGETMSGATSQVWLKIDGGEAKNVTILVEAADIISCEQCAIWLEEGNSPVWVYTGPDDPCHDLNVERRYRAYLPVLTAEGESKVWSMGKQAHQQLLEIDDAVGSIKGVEIRIKRTGVGLATRYTITQTGVRRDVSRHPEVDVIPLLGPITTEGVRDLLCTKLGKGSYEEVIASYKGKSSTTKPRKAGLAGKVSRDKIEAEEEDLEEVELLR